MDFDLTEEQKMLHDFATNFVTPRSAGLPAAHGVFKVEGADKSGGV